MRFLKPIVKAWLPAILWAGLILFASSDLFSSDSSGSLFQAFFGFQPPPWLHFTLRKLAHLVTYAILAILVWRADRRWIVILSIALAVATADESLQGRTARRTGSVGDVGIDVVGATIAVIAMKAHRLTGSQAHRKQHRNDL